MSRLKNNKGFTLLEIIVSIAVASIIFSMLVQLLVLSIEARNQTYVNNQLQTESYLIAEEIRWNVFDHETQFVSITDTGNITVSFHHEWDITIDESYAIYFETSTVPDDLLVLDKTNNKLTYNGVDLHSSNVYIDDTSTITVTPVDTTCDPTSDPAVELCSDVALKLTLWIRVENNGIWSDLTKFETTIII